MLADHEGSKDWILKCLWLTDQCLGHDCLQKTPQKSVLPSFLLERVDALGKKVHGMTQEVRVVGRTGAGKSTLINALLGTPILPANKRPCTAVETRISSHPSGNPQQDREPRVELCYGRQAPEVGDMQLLWQCSKLASPVTIPELVTIHMDADMLEDFSFVDTPGMTIHDVPVGMDEFHKLVLVVMDFNVELEGEDNYALQKWMALCGPRMLVVYTKLDAYEGEDIDAQIAKKRRALQEMHDQFRRPQLPRNAQSAMEEPNTTEKFGNWRDATEEFANTRVYFTSGTAGLLQRTGTAYEPKNEGEVVGLSGFDALCQYMRWRWCTTQSSPQLQAILVQLKVYLQWLLVFVVGSQQFWGSTSGDHRKALKTIQERVASEDAKVRQFLDSRTDCLVLEIRERVKGFYESHTHEVGKTCASFVPAANTLREDGSQGMYCQHVVTLYEEHYNTELLSDLRREIKRHLVTEVTATLNGVSGIMDGLAHFFFETLHMDHKGSDMGGLPTMPGFECHVPSMPPQEFWGAFNSLSNLLASCNLVPHAQTLAVPTYGVSDMCSEDIVHYEGSRIQQALNHSIVQAIEEGLSHQHAMFNNHILTIIDPFTKCIKEFASQTSKHLLMIQVLTADFVSVGSQPVEALDAWLKEVQKGKIEVCARKLLTEVDALL